MSALQQSWPKSRHTHTSYLREECGQRKSLYGVDWLFRRAEGSRDAEEGYLASVSRSGTSPRKGADDRHPLPLNFRSSPTTVPGVTRLSQ